MTQGLITRQYVEDIADAIREKTGENGVYYPSEMANAIMNIPTASGGLNLNTSLVLETNKTSTTGKVTLTATLSADYDDLTPSDVDLHGFLQGATVNFYDSEGTSLASSITNENGVVVVDIIITKTSTVYCSFAGTSDYEPCTSNEINITFEETIIFIEDYIGDPYAKYNILTNTTGLLEYRDEGNDKILFAQTTNSTDFVITPNINPILSDDVNFRLECDWKFSNMWNGGGIDFVKEDGSVPSIEQHIFQFYNSGSGDNVPFKFRSNLNEYHYLKLEYINGVFSCWVDNISLGTYTNQVTGKIGLRFGGDRTNFNFYLKNIKVEVL